MGAEDTLTLESRVLTAGVNLQNGQLFSLVRQGVEYMHPGGKPGATADDKKGWGHSELIMFPVVGKSEWYEANGQRFPMSQHGLVRHLPWTRLDETSTSVVLEQKYQGGSVRNTKYRAGAAEHMDLQGLPYLFQKSYAVHQNFTARFYIKNVCDEPLPYDWGWHPAFAAEKDAVVRVESTTIPLAELQEIEGASKHSAQEAVLETGGRMVRLRSDAEFMQIWSPPGSSLVCIEPITKHPSAKSPANALMPGQSRIYTVEIDVA